MKVKGRAMCVLPLYDEADQPIGLAEWWDSERRVIVGGTIQVPTRLTVRILWSGTAPAVELKIEVSRGVPRCKALSITSKTNGREVTARDLKDIRIDDWIEAAVANTAREVVAVRGRGHLRRITQDQATRSRARSTLTVVRAPNKIDDEFLQAVAQTYRDNIHDKPVGAVATAFRVENSTAGKYILRARAKGYLPPTTPGKKLG